MITPKIVGDPWMTAAEKALEALAASGQLFTSDDLAIRVGMPTPRHRMSAVFGIARRDNKITPVGTRRGRDGWVLQVWVGVDATGDPDVGDLR